MSAIYYHSNEGKKVKSFASNDELLSFADKMAARESIEGTGANKILFVCIESVPFNLTSWSDVRSCFG